MAIPIRNYFVDGITDDLTTDLSRMPDSFVIARNTAFTYKGKDVDAKEIGRELGVRYLLEGSVRRTGETVEVNAQLVSTETGAHVWADRFEGERSNLGKLQFEVVARLAHSLKRNSSRRKAFGRYANGPKIRTRPIWRAARRSIIVVEQFQQIHLSRRYQAARAARLPLTHTI